MTALPSLVDVLFIIVLLVPGFISLTILRLIAIFEKELTDSRLLIWSLFMSLITYGGVSYFTGLTTFDAIRDNILIPKNFIVIALVSIAIGVLPGIVIRYGFRRGQFVRGDSWEASMNVASKKGSWVIIYTSNGQEFMGFLNYTGGKGFAKEVTIREPKQIFRDPKGFLLEAVEMGKEILFSEKDIARIVFFETV